MGGRLARESFKSGLAIGFFSRPPLAVVPQSRLIAGSAFHEQPRSAFKGESCGVYQAGCLPVLETMELVSLRPAQQCSCGLCVFCPGPKIIVLPGCSAEVFTK